MAIIKQITSSPEWANKTSTQKITETNNILLFGQLLFVLE